MSVKRRLFTILSAVSLVLCLATAAVWVWSHHRNYAIYGSHLGSGLEGLWAQWATDVQVTNAWPGWSHRALGFAYERNPLVHIAMLPGPLGWRKVGLPPPGSPVRVCDRITIPFWFVFSVTALPPATWLCVAVRRRRQTAHRHRLGLCLTCGYDLRASSERCPECGTVIPADLVRRPVA